MTRPDEQLNQVLHQLFRLEYTKMTAVLCRHFGLKQLEIAEDIVSETFLKATETWNDQGLPENPSAWLYTVAKNKTKDYLKRASIFENRVKNAIDQETFQPEPDFEFTNEAIADSQLSMLFAVCSPAISEESQICLALQILCGFTVEEIANAFLTKTETIKKRLLRARAALRNDYFEISQLEESATAARLDTVLRTLYLLFNEGYFSKSGNHLIRKDLCSEAMRLAVILAESNLSNMLPAKALLALMCYQSSRFHARLDDDGDTVLFEQQDRSRWDQELIDRGHYYLINACSGDEISKYHLEAGIAYWHTTSEESVKWSQILHLYNQLIVSEYSPMTALNRTFAFAKVYGNAAGLEEAEKLHLADNSYYHSLLGYLYTEIDHRKAIFHYQQAVNLTKSKAEKQTLSRTIAELERSAHELETTSTNTHLPT
ncbi:RNA polymerase sigma factor [Dyadobacter pollutisoli]|jgi:RNA polymerase sigma-70 factor (ECF subfamily)|uniref:Sigma-70 family RNA polymerase sigma factor n=1 Tax=Dyadobacter pollutisoli TaxID=2910158 RepID=A0A9E8NEZ8_9BACT|nr:sigma-70 family RNA polymerase sigma factor [Dyadobacter pollutisoli]WAC14738.1 sigma-70 family RNA polymerase sigma factor [Dyadobacter pollutisoli]